MLWLQATLKYVFLLRFHCTAVREAKHVRPAALCVRRQVQHLSYYTAFMSEQAICKRNLEVTAMYFPTQITVYSKFSGSLAACSLSNHPKNRGSTLYSSVATRTNKNRGRDFSNLVPFSHISSSLSEHLQDQVQVLLGKTKHTNRIGDHFPHHGTRVLRVLDTESSISLTQPMPDIEMGDTIHPSRGKEATSMYTN